MVARYLVKIYQNLVKHIYDPKLKLALQGLAFVGQFAIQMFGQIDRSDSLSFSSQVLFYPSGSVASSTD